MGDPQRLALGACRGEGHSSDTFLVEEGMLVSQIRPKGQRFSCPEAAVAIVERILVSSVLWRKSCNILVILPDMYDWCMLHTAQFMSALPTKHTATTVLALPQISTPSSFLKGAFVLHGPRFNDVPIHKSS